MERKEALERMLELVQGGTGVLTAGEIHPDIPTIHDVGHREGQRLRVDSEVVHCGWGLFRANLGGGQVFFDGGGAMRDARDGDAWVFSWCPFTTRGADLSECGYDFGAVESALAALLKEV